MLFDPLESKNFQLKKKPGTGVLDSNGTASSEESIELYLKNCSNRSKQLK